MGVIFMQIESTNSVARLCILVSKLKKESRSNPSVVFSNVFEIEEDNILELMSAYADLMKLCNDSNTIVDKYCPNKTLAKKHISNIIYALSKINFNDSFGMDDFKNNLSKSSLESLELLCTMLPSDGEVLSDEELNEIYENINTISSDISNSNINNDLKEILIDRIQDILLIIRKYKTHGTNELLKSIETSIGSIYTNQPNIKSEEEVNLCRSIVSKLLKTITCINQNIPLIEFASKVLVQV
jgi:hypothetical protein